jgi:hypothetical protein
MPYTAQPLWSASLIIQVENFNLDNLHSKTNGARQLLIYTDDVNLLGDNIDTTKKNSESLIEASKKVGLEVKTEKAKYMLLSRHQNAGYNHGINIGNMF